MKKLQKSKKGFTLTELAIVIAVIAILIAVLVPTFISLINKANESSDSQLVKNLNTALAVDEASNGSAETMSEALEVAADYGYNVDKLTPSSSGDIVWDQASNRFLLIDEEGEIVYYDSSVTSANVTSTTYQLWYIAQKESDIETDKYSYYIAYTTTAVSATYGVDVGNNTGVAVSISGSKEASIIVNTNGGSLTINAENYDVYHYGTASTVTITKVAATSYHLYGEVASKIEIAQGRVVCEAGSSVLSIIVTGTISESAGSYNISVVVDVAAEVGGIGTSNDNNLSSLASIVTGDGSSSTSVNTTTATYNTAFAGGTGESGSPYLIETAEQFVNIGSLSEEMQTTAYYFQLTSDITVNHTQDTYITKYLNGVFDGDNHSITVSADVGKSTSGYGDFWFFEKPIITTVKNLTIYETSFNLAMTYGWNSAGSDELTFDNVKIGDSTCVSTSLMAYRNTSAFIQYFYGGTLTFNKCINYYSYQSDDSGTYMAVFLGGYANSSVVNFNECVNYGTLKLPYAGVFIGNGSYTSNDKKSTFSVTACENYGDIYFYEGGSLIAAINSDAVKTDVEEIFDNGMKVSSGDVYGITDSNLKLTYDTENALTLTSGTNYSQYLLTYSRYATYKGSDSSSSASGTGLITISFEITTGNVTSWGYGIKFYDLTSYKSLETAQDVSALTELTDVYYSCSFGGVTVYYDSSNNAFVVDYSSVESENGLVYTLSGAATVKVAAYSDSKLKAISTATAAE